MKRLFALSAWACAVVYMTNTAVADENMIGAQAELGMAYFKWNPDARAVKDPQNPLLYKTEGLEVANLSAGIRIYGQPFAVYSIKRPIRNTPHQQAMLSTNTTQDASAEEKRLYIDLLGLSRFFDSPLMRRLLSLRYERSRELYFGNLTIGNSILYYDDNRNETILPAKSLIAFRSVFEDEGLTIDLFWIGALRTSVGVFKSRWERPSQVYFSSTNKRIFSAGYDIVGGSISANYETRSSPFFTHVEWRSSTRASIHTAFDTDSSFKYNSVLVKGGVSAHFGVVGYRLGLLYKAHDLKFNKVVMESEMRVHAFGEMNIVF